MSIFDDFKHLFTLIYIIPSYILYGTIIYLIFFSSVKNKFSSSFYWIFGFSTINYILHSIVYYLLIRFTAIPALFSFLKTLPKENILYPVVYCLLFYSGFAMHLYGLMISFNRFTVFWLKMKYEIFWKKHLKKMICFCGISPFFLLWNFPFIAIQNSPIDGYGAYISNTIEFPTWWLKSRNLVIEICIASSLSLMLNIYVVYSIIKFRYLKNNSEFHVSSQDIALAAYSMLLFIGESSSGAVQTHFAIDKNTFYGPIIKNLWIIDDFNALTPVWFILITNKKIRKEVFALFFRRNSHNSQLFSTVVPF